MHACIVPVTPSSQSGRPRFHITREQLQYLQSMSFNWVQIATILGVSRMTVYCRRRQFGLTDMTGTPISDIELIHALHQMRRDFPAMGQTMVWAQLRSLGYHVTRGWLREAITMTDPISAALRWRECLNALPTQCLDPTHCGI